MIDTQKGNLKSSFSSLKNFFSDTFLVSLKNGSLLFNSEAISKLIVSRLLN
jgi:hypothetical protein